MVLLQPVVGAAALTSRNPYATHCTLCSGNAREGGDWRRTRYELGEAPQVLRDRGQRELELCSARAAKAQSVKPQNTLEVREQHLDFLAITA
jgi:hypothetical protein